MRLVWIVLALLPVVAGCTAIAPYAKDEVIAAVSYRDNGPREFKLMTVINVDSGSAAHSALLINGPERILFDPAGSFEYGPIPERNDVLFGISPQNEFIYKTSHASEKRYIQIQTVPLSEEQGQAAYQAALNWGASPAAHCTQATSGVIRSIPGFERINRTWYPRKLADQLSTLPNVTEELYYEGDEATLEEALQAFEEELKKYRRKKG
ncbi:MAG: hypothetical protein ACWA5A_18375 [Marinibacterium sp.]